MKVIRSICSKDLDAFQTIAQATGIGMTSIPKNRTVLQELIHQSQTSFASKIDSPHDETYLFVLEDLITEEVGGVCGIYAKTGVKQPTYFYQIETLKSPPSPFPIPKHFTLLHPISQSCGPSELCSLYLLPHFRKEGLGKLLSFSRLLFISTFPQRFDETIYAELRGYIDSHNESPFWNGLGRFFLPLSFKELNSLLDGRRNFFAEGLPCHPIYVMLLCIAAQKAIQKTHPNTKNALQMLLSEGFHLSTRINPIDGGPIVKAAISSIHTIRESRMTTVKKITDKLLNAKSHMISNEKIDFRCCYAKLQPFSDGQVVLERQTANALRVEIGDRVRLA